MPWDCSTLAFAELLTRIQDREWAAMVELHTQFGEEVFHACHAITDDALAAELITIDVFVQVWDQPEALTGPAAPANPDALGRAMVAQARNWAVLWCVEEQPAESDLDVVKPPVAYGRLPS
ncbi:MULTISPECIES: hypothetical protein [unclassified Crossiella]|uniref:hypothetical protein n=1 Tax=unclassified Crossiella TaxID=2620835 RepID=UPI001FFF6C7B|nr:MULTISPECIES: hypothetical protein [unclassified Crossiella]MCK2244604.1 hypothetical protein [Crossiella sp. S99.2]MCK2258235.1 hypothetical protein [Crossiella sp. S99.1]